MKRASILFVLLSTGCGNWSDSDAQFLAAIPRKEDLTLSAPASSQSQSLTSELSQQKGALGASSVYSDVVGQVKDINAFVSALAGGLDSVRTLPPSQRLADARVWGPFDDDKHPGLQVQLVLSRTSTTEYGYAVQFRRKGEQDFVNLIVGVFHGEKASRGIGGFHIDGVAGKALGVSQEKDADSADLGYDMRSGTDNSCSLKAQSTAFSIEYNYLVKPDGGGGVDYTLHKDFVTTTPAQETLAVSARWTADRAGFAQATITGGDLGATVGRHSECWNAAFGQVFSAQNFECSDPTGICQDGQRDACVISPDWP